MVALKKILQHFALSLLIGISILFLASEIKFFKSNYSSDPGPVLANGGIAGGDFVPLYAGARLTKDDFGNQYNFSFQRDFYSKHFDGTKYHAYFSPFAYPPLVATLLMPLSSLDFYSAFLTFSGISIFLGAFAIGLTLAPMKIWLPWKLGLFLFSLSFIPFAMDTIGGGQMASIGMFISALLYITIRSERFFLAGLILSFSYYKPPLFLFLLLAILLRRETKVIAGFLVGAAALMTLTLNTSGVHGFQRYLSIVSSYRSGSELVPGFVLDANQGVGLYALLTRSLAGHLSLTAWVCALGFALYKASKTRINHDLDSIFPFLLCMSLFLSVQVLRYDLAILLVPSLVLIERFKVREKNIENILLALLLSAISFIRLFDSEFGVALTICFTAIVGIFYYEAFFTKEICINNKFKNT